MNYLCAISLVLMTFTVTANSFANENKTYDEQTHSIALDELVIGGTLTLPTQPKSNALVIMISGSGPQDRDETLFGFKVFKIIAAHLGEKGIASFRFDDRGEGESTGDFTQTTLNDHVSDINAIINYFKSSSPNRYETFILLGHSQGGIVSGKVARKNYNVKKLILMAAPSVPIIDLVLYQVRQELIDQGLNHGLIEREVSAHHKLMHALVEGEKVAQSIALFYDTAKLLQLAQQPLDATQLESIALDKTETFKTIYQLPSLTSFLYYDPANDYEKLTIPVLALFGGNDMQVTIAQNKDKMERALLNARTPYQFVTFDDANHFFQQAQTVQKQEYEALDKQFVVGFLDELSNWILKGL
ncbi:hypothetical protein D210916BOD24_12590 [Alteromonas sp. D210916BOD_24]|uniref:alpha/beta hydrolase family protein n=1 Tax=Alteromonas sp. D210916BOD_24 TaxID=3157618 RepID=UPI00399C7CD1